MRARALLAAAFAGVALGACGAKNALPPPRAPLVATPVAPFRATLPVPSRAAARTVPMVQDFSLPNGMRVLLVERTGTPLVTARFVSRRGGDEAGNPAGLAMLTIRAMLDGSTVRDGVAMSDALAERGIELGGGLSPDAGVLTARFLAPEAASAVALLAETIITPAFPAAELANDVNALATLRLETGALGSVSRELALSSLFGLQNPYGRPASGFAPTLRALSRDDVVAFHRSHYVPGESALVVVGGISRAALEPLVTRAFGAWSPRSTAPAPAAALYAPSPGPRFVLAHSPGSPQSQIVLAMRAPPEGSPDQLPAALLAAGLGGMFSSRLNRELRERQGYTYGVHASMASFRQSGVLMIRCAVGVQQTAQALGQILSLVQRVRPSGLDADEFAAAQALARQEADTAFDSDASAVAALTDLFTYGLPADYFATLGPRIAGVTRDDIRRVSQWVLDLENARVAVGGDRFAIEAGIASVGLGPPAVFLSQRRE